MKHKRPILSYSEPETEEHFATNLVYLLRENEDMKDFEAFFLGSTLDASRTNGVRWTFLKEIMPKLNEYFLKLWEEGEQLKNNKEEIERLRELLKRQL